ncbi:MAG: GntR family transcriptional regulator [Gallionella sp.]|nr:GntR family transcriptional regulator [Gallionella sp.]
MKQKTKLTHSESVRMSIEHDILTGQLPPGSPIDEDAISERFAVSRTPVREAMLQLIESGLVEKNSRQRATVAKLDVRRLLQLFEALSEVEGLCARIATRRMTKTDKDELMENHEAAAKSLAAHDKDEYFRLGRRFHGIIILGTHNDALIEMTNKLVLPLVPYRRFQLGRAGRQEMNQSDHGLILDAVLAGNADDACNLMRRHNTVQGDVLAEYVSMESEPRHTEF